MTRGTLRFAAGEAAKTLSVLLTDDANVEQDEQVSLSLSNAGGTGCALGETSSAMLTIVDNDTVLSNVSPLEDASFFVRQHYHDFLNREPDDEGLAFWSNQLTACGTDVRCIQDKRVHVSAAFFLSIEFKETGYLVDRFYKATYGRRPRMVEFLPDTQEASRGLIVGTLGWQDRLEQNKRAFAAGWVTRPQFRNAMDALGNAAYVDKLFANAGVSPPADLRASLVAGLDAGTETRASVLTKVVEGEEFARREESPAFVLMQYLGYLRRDPDEPGFNFWLQKLTNHGGNYVAAEMVKSFLVSSEYGERFLQQ
jgi:hypothetical protein